MDACRLCNNLLIYFCFDAGIMWDYVTGKDGDICIKIAAAPKTSTCALQRNSPFGPRHLKMYMPSSIFTSSSFGIIVLCLAQLVASTPVPTDVGICIHNTYDAFEVVNECLTTRPNDFKTCHPRVTKCIKSTCGLYVASSWWTFQLISLPIFPCW